MGIVLGTFALGAVESQNLQEPMPSHQSIQQSLQRACNPPDPKKLFELARSLYSLPSSNPTERRNKALLYLTSIGVADAYLAKNPTTGKHVVSGVMPPLEAGLPPGIDPSAVKDTKMRAEYETAIKKNEELAKALLERRIIEDFRKGLWNHAVTFCAFSYDTTEEDQEVLARDISGLKESANFLSEVAALRHKFPK